MKPLSAALIPLRILYRLHIFYLLYVLTIAYVLHLLVPAVLHEYNAWLEQFTKDYGVSLFIWEIMSRIGDTLAVLIVLPFVIALLAGPARHVFLYARIVPGTLLSEIPQGVKNTFHASIISSVRLVVALIPVLILQFGYTEWAAHHSDRAIQQAYILAASLTSLTIVYHQIPVFFAPILAAMAGYNGHATLRLAPIILQSNRMKLTGLVGLWVATMSGFSTYAATYIPLEWQSTLIIAVYGFISWYFLNQLFYVVLGSTALYEQQKNGLPTGPRAPYPQASARVENIVVS
jgi:hypothetical protein